MNTLGAIIPIASLLLLITTGALYTEYAGRMALFLDGIINLSAFLCFAFTFATGNIFIATCLSCFLCTALTFALERLATKCKADMFLVSLAMNLFFSALASLISSLAFGTRGVLYSNLVMFDAKTVRLVTSALCIVFSAALIALLVFTREGLRFRITGSSPQVLDAQGISSDTYRALSWICAALTSSFAGCALCMRLSSFVPGMASGRGWTALAAVFLGRKNPLLVILAVLVFAVAEYASSYIQNIPQFAGISSGLLLALPYLLALLLMFFSKRSESE